MKKTLLFYIFLILSCNIFATHLAGGEIFYQSLGGNQYLVTLNVFRDCSGISLTSATITFSSSCGQNFTINGVQVGGAQNVSQLCPSQINNSTCGSGTLPGMEKYTYTVVATMPPCSSWIISWTDGSRNGSINCPASGSADFFVPAFLNNVLAPTNNSPSFNSPPQPYFCVNQQACLNLATIEVDGNTLSYSLVSALSSAGTSLAYTAPYSSTSPITGITINPSTGQLNFSSGLIGNFIVVVKCTETDVNGNIIGYVIRDFQVIVTNCTNQTVTCGQGAITNVTSGTAPSGNTLQICENIPFCFDVSFTDPDINDSVKVTSPNISSSLPGSSMVTTYTPGVKNQLKATICWTPPAGSSGLNTSFVLIVKDNACPVPGTQVINYFIDVLPATSAGPDITICGAQTASINATGSSTVFAWSDLAGNPITVGPEFSCNPCNNPIIKPAVTSTYIVTNVGGGTNCKNKDTLIITVVADFTLTAGSSVANSCLNSAVQFTSNVNPPGAGYTYTWSPSAPLTSTNTPNTSATFSVPGSYNYTVTAISSLGCTKQSSSVPLVAQPVTMPIFTVVPTNTTICSGTNVPLSINFNTSPPTSCGLAATGCATASVKTIGTGIQLNGTSSYPSPYANYYDSQHFQILYTAAELSAAGVVPGKINSLAFNVSALNSLVNPLKNFTIKIKCTSAGNTSTFDMAGLSQVYFNASQPVVNGWNTHNFSQSYSWTGSNNLLIDICYDDSGIPFTENASSPYTSTAFTSIIWYRADATNTCPLTTSSGTSSNRPNARFGNCSSTPPASSFSYFWSPSTGLSNPTISNPITNLSSSIQYSVVVTPTAATTCSNISTTSLTVVSPVMPTITAVSALCTNAPTFTLSASPAGGTWSLTPSTSTLGVFSPSLAAIGNNTVSYSYGGAGCLQTTTAIVPIEKYVPSTITGTINPLCISNPVANLSTALTTSTLGVGVWSGNGVTGNSFDPAVAGAATHTLTYSTQSNPTATLCPSSSTIAVAVNSVVQPTISIAGPFCDNFAPQQMTAAPVGGVWSATLVGTSVSASGLFTPSASLLGNNKLYYTLTNAPCVKKDSIIVDVVQFIPATLTGTLGPYCIYNPAVNLQSITQFTGGVWSGNGVSTSSFTPSAAGAGTNVITYSTDPTPNGLCPDSENIFILVNDKPEANAFSDNSGGCNYPWNVLYSTSTVNTGIASWDFGDGSANGNGLVVSHTYKTPGTYFATITYTDNAGCKDTTQTLSAVTIYPVPDAEFEPSLEVTTLIDAEIVFTNQTSDLPNNTYTWDFGDVGGSTEVSPTYLFTNSGEYFIKLIAVSANLCQDTVIKKIIIKPDVVLYVPNAFTPGNDDGLNDVFKIFLPPTGVDYSTFSLSIYDRWGEVIYKTNEVNESWNGAKNNSGPVLKQDIFVWKINFQDEKKKYYSKTGHVSLLHK